MSLKFKYYYYLGKIKCKVFKIHSYDISIVAGNPEDITEICFFCLATKEIDYSIDIEDFRE